MSVRARLLIVISCNFAAGLMACSGNFRGFLVGWILVVVGAYNAYSIERDR